MIEIFLDMANRWGFVRTIVAFLVMGIALFCGLLSAVVSDPIGMFQQLFGSDIHTQTLSFNWWNVLAFVTTLTACAVWGSILIGEPIKQGDKMDWKAILIQLIQTPALWVAVVGLYHFFVTWLAPTFPIAGLSAIDAVVFVIASVVTGQVIRAADATKKLIAELKAKVTP